MIVKFKSTLIRDSDGLEDEIDVFVEAEVEPGGGDGWNEPYYGPEARINIVKDSKGNKLELTKEEERILTHEVYEQAEAEAEDEEAYAADLALQEWKESRWED